MTCKRCAVSMKEQRGVHHGQRKFRCPRCGCVRMQKSRPERR